MPIIKGVLSRNIDGNLEYIYPRTSIDMIEVDGEKTVYDILNENNINIEHIKNILGIEIYNFSIDKPYKTDDIVVHNNKLYKFKEDSSGNPDNDKWEELNILDLLSMVSRHLKAMKGATATKDGSGGYIDSVPPKDGYDTKFLRADGTWAVPAPTSEWSINTKDQDGYVPAPTESNPNKVWKTDENGIPAWRDDHGNDYSLQDLVGLTSIGSSTRPIYYDGVNFKQLEYTIEKSVPADAKFTDTNTWRGIQNNLTSTSTEESLSAAQGKVLNDKFDNYTPKDVIGDLADLETDDTSNIVNAINSINNSPSPMPPEPSINIVDNLDSTSDTDALSANQGRVLNEKFDNYAEKDNVLNKNDIVDDLSSIDTDKPLSANQGKVINDKFNDYVSKDNGLTKEDIINNLSTVNTDKVLSAAQGKVLNEKFDNYTPKDVIGELSDLETNNKDSIVSSINSILNDNDQFLSSDDVIDDLNSYATNKPLSAYQGKLLNEKIVNNPALNVIDTLTSTSTDKPLSAYQGKVLNDKLDRYATINITGNLSELNTSNKDNLVSAINYVNNDKISQSSIVNNLSSTSTSRPLSAYQGKILNDKIQNASTNFETVYSDETLNIYRNGQLYYCYLYNLPVGDFNSYFYQRLGYKVPKSRISIPAVLSYNGNMFIGYVYYNNTSWYVKHFNPAAGVGNTEDTATIYATVIFLASN